MAAPVLIGLVAGIIALAGIVGGTEHRPTPARAFLFGLPLFVAAGATILPVGATWWSILAMAVAVVVGMIVAGRLGGLLDVDAVASPAAATVIAALQSTVAVVLAAVAVRWLAPMIAAVAPVNAGVVAVVCVSAAVAAAVFGGGSVGMSRTVLIMSIVAAALLLVIGVVLGTPARSLDPVAEVPGPTALAVIASVVATILAAAVHPGLRDLGRQSVAGLTRGALITGAVMLLGLLGLAWFAGASVAFPSLPVSVVAGYIAFAPSLIPALFGALFTAVMTIVVAAGLSAALLPWSQFDAEAPGGWLAYRPVAIVTAGIGVVAVALVPLSGGWMLGTLGVVAATAVLLGLRTNRRLRAAAPSRRPSPERSASPAPG
jgi:hypothetical protein